MAAPWFYCDDLSAQRVVLEAAESHHALHALRLRNGAEVVLFDGRGQTATGLLESAPGDSARRKGRCLVAVTLVERRAIPYPVPALTLYVAACKGARPEWLVEKATELGVAALILVDFERSVVRTGPQHVEKLHRTAIAACKQCQRAWVPDIRVGATLPRILASVAPGALAMAVPSPEAEPFLTWLHNFPLTEPHGGVLIGPEGGFSPAECELARCAEVPTVQLGAQILRVETAATLVAAVWAAWTNVRAHEKGEP
ncbi:MAG: 16S rRNA (uracil(1498)-N(3))-methyltransferase [Phycisphaerales bacterium]|nr:16S rRNA (uracil(1498)-N(3))-methyltransferase [Phycisphaerales bacterium]